MIESMPVGIGVKVLIPRIRGGEQHEIEYCLQERSSDEHGRKGDVLGGRAELTDQNATATGKREVKEETGHELSGDIVPIAVQRIDRSDDRLRNPDITDVIRWTTITAPQDSEEWDPTESDENKHKGWFTRREIAAMRTDDYLPKVVEDGGPLDQLERSGVILLGTAAIEKFVRDEELLG